MEEPKMKAREQLTEALESWRCRSFWDGKGKETSTALLHTMVGLILSATTATPWTRPPHFLWRHAPTSARLPCRHGILVAVAIVEALEVLRFTLFEVWSVDLPSTISTARGGGGSFKNRKRIGEIDCCEWRMSEQNHWPTDWLAKWLIDWLTIWLTE